MITKAQLRKDIAVKRRSLDSDWIETASVEVVKHLQMMDVFQSSNTVALYMAISGEVKLTTLFPICWALGKRTFVPVFNADLICYEMTETTAETRYRIGNHGIQEPVSPSPVPVSGIDLVIVPGVAFDPSGNRLGRGGGYYDRLLNGFTGFAAAVAFDFQILPHVPSDIYDIPVDYVVTEKKIVTVRNEH